MKNKPNKARLSKAEARCYSNAFESYMNHVRRDAKRADKAAWRECVEAFPRLAKYQGALP